MTVPYTPTPLTQAVINPSVGGSGANALPYLSTSMYSYAPTAIDWTSLTKSPGLPNQLQVLSDTIRRASRWADNYCFGADQAAKGASLAASLSVESIYTRIKTSELRLICDYKPILELVGCDVGSDPSSVSSIGAIASSVRFGRRTIYVPMYLPFSGRNGTPIQTPSGIGTGGNVYAVWSYVNGYPHTKLAASITAGATSCVVDATDGNGGLWGVYPGTQLTIPDGVNTESVTVTSVTPGTTTATIETSGFVNAHNVPNAPDFLPVSAVPADVQQAVISLTTMLIKTRGARALVMPKMPGGGPERQAFAQAGAMEDWDIATGILDSYTVRLKSKV